MDSLFNLNDQLRKENDHLPDEYSCSIEVRDGYGKLIGYIGDYVDASFVFSSDAGNMDSSQIIIPGSSPWTKLMMRANLNIILVHFLLYRHDKLIKVWTGRVDRSVRTVEHGQGQVTVELISDKAWLKYINAPSAPFSSINVQFPRTRVKIGPAIHEMKQFLSDNLLRVQNGWNIGLAPISTWQEDPSRWGAVSNYFPYLKVVPTTKYEDRSPTVALTAQMTPMDEIWDQTCKDLNLLPIVRMHIPGRDPSPPRIPVNGPAVIFDILDKDLDRSRNGAVGGGGFFSAIGVFLRGIFGRYDVPTTPANINQANLGKFFGQYTTDKWVVFRTSEEHWNSIEVASYAPTTHTSIAGGKSHDFLNKGVEMIFNYLIKWVLSKLSFGLISGNIVDGWFDDVLFAYQKAEDAQMKQILGPFCFSEEYVGKGATAWSMDAAQNLRSARYAAVGYKTASFTGDAASFPPFRPFEDFDLLDPGGWEDIDEDIIVMERFKQITVNMNRDSGFSFEVRLGENERPEEPWAVQQRINEGFQRAFNIALNLD